MERDRLLLDYDCEQDDGAAEPARLIFEEVLAFEYRDSTSCQAEDVLPPTEIRILEQSRYLDSVRSLWEERVGWQDWQRQQGEATRFKHFTVYFDDVGCLHVIASHCKVASD